MRTFLSSIIYAYVAAMTLVTGSLVTIGQDNSSSSTSDAKAITPAVRDALTPAFKNLVSANSLRTTVKMTVMSAVGDQLLGKNEGVFQIASQRPNLLSLSAKFNPESVLYVCDGDQLYVQLSESDYLVLSAPSGFQELINSMPVQLGPQPETMFWLSLAGLNPVSELLGGLQNADVVQPTNPVTGELSTTTVRCVRPEGLVRELTVSTDQQPRPVRLLIDMTELIKQTNGASVPEGFSYKIQYDFESWETNVELSKDIFKLEIPDNAARYSSLADYLVRDGAMAAHPLLGKPAPAFAARLYEGEEVSFEPAPEGKVIVLDFWATWCGPCVESLPEFAGLVDQFKDKEVSFYAVNVSESPEAIGEFLKDQKLELPVLVDPEGRLSAAFGATAIPQTVLIGRDGRVEAVHVGFDEKESTSILEKEIETLLAGRRIFQAEEVTEDQVETADSTTATNEGDAPGEGDK